MHHVNNTLVQLLRSKGLTLALAESVTCGLAAHQLCTCIGTSEVLQGSVVCYTAEVKCAVLGVSPARIKKYTAESQEVTDDMATKLRQLITADIYAAITGLAAPGGSETKGKPVGTIFLSVYYEGRRYRRRQLFRGRPVEVRRKACRALYSFIIEIVAAGSAAG